ncbi:MAG: CRISPR-associated helicase Cas3' [Armatimonadota bacterium]|nr:CRISPR-associated helicase Cas3' [Armatimonadota bacterium]
MDFNTAWKLLQRKPAPHQLATWQALAHGSSVILHAPTGSGKTEAAVLPFLAGAVDAPRLTYVLPMRALADQIGDRLRRHATALGAPETGVAVFHGEAATVRDFPPRILVTTLDQAVAAYAATPLSAPLRWGHVLGGHLATSMVVFDEVHLYDPDLGLQAALVMAEGVQAAGMPVVFATATLPGTVLGQLQEILGATLIRGDPLFPASVEILCHDRRLQAEDVLRKLQCGCDRLLVFCNTVDRAQQLYRAISTSVSPPRLELLLVHSRFTADHRLSKERELQRLLGRTATHAPCVCIATSAAEAGSDISAPDVLTEICPADSFIQRAGRCARWGGDGRVEVFTGDIDETHGPYDTELCRKTAEELHKRGSFTLDWKTACDIVNLAHSGLSVRRPKSLARVCALIDEGTYSASRHRIHEAVREHDRVEVSVHDGPIPEPPALLPRVPVRAGVLWKMRGSEARRWVAHSCDPATVKLEKVRPGDWVILPTKLASYSPELGLELGRPGQPMTLLPQERTDSDPVPEGPHSYGDIPWVTHTAAVLCFLLQRRMADLERVCRVLGAGTPQLLAALLALHDLGKLARDWQQNIGLPNPPLSHYTRSRATNPRRMPPHATVSALALQCALRELGTPGTAAQYAIAHHHQARAAECPPYELVPGFEELVKEALRPLDASTATRIVDTLGREDARHGGPAVLPKILPVTRRPQLWVAYLALSRLLVEADRWSLNQQP